MARFSPFPPDPQRPTAVNVERAALLLGCSRRTVYNRISSGRLVALAPALGQGLRITLESIEAELALAKQGLKLIKRHS